LSTGLGFLGRESACAQSEPQAAAALFALGAAVPTVEKQYADSQLEFFSSAIGTASYSIYYFLLNCLLLTRRTICSRIGKGKFYSF
jgi:hypothetical protein